jgi:hypothetical protein
MTAKKVWQKPGPRGPRTNPRDIAWFIYKHISKQTETGQKNEIEAAIQAAMAHFRIGRSTAFKAWKEEFLKIERSNGAIPYLNWRALIRE